MYEYVEVNQLKKIPIKEIKSQIERICDKYALINYSIYDCYNEYLCDYKTYKQLKKETKQIKYINLSYHKEYNILHIWFQKEKICWS